MVTDEEKIRYLVSRRFLDVRHADERQAAKDALIAEARERAAKAKKVAQVNLERTYPRKTYPRRTERLTPEQEEREIERKAREAEQKVKEAERKSLALAYERELSELPTDELEEKFQAELLQREEDQRPETTSELDVAPLADKSEAQSERRSGWVIKKASGNRWLCGLENDLKLIKGTEGFQDLLYAVRGNGEDCDPLELLANSHEDIAAAAALKFQSSPEAIDPTTRTAVEGAIDDAKREREAAQERDDIDAIEAAEEKLTELQQYLKDSTRPGGRSRRLTAGDSHNKAIRAMRGRRNTVLKHLRNAGLSEMADHIQENYILRTKTFAYHGSSLKVILEPQRHETHSV